MTHETLTLPCQCGNQLSASGEAGMMNARLKCDCGRAYAVTITPLTNETKSV
jgi:hypothetical protein